MAYYENIAMKRDSISDLNNPVGEYKEESAQAASGAKSQSNQEKSQPASAIIRTVSEPIDKYNSGPFVKLGPNTKNTGKVGVPVSVALDDPSTAPATENPSGKDTINAGGYMSGKARMGRWPQSK